jgi:hypothetical protein
VRHSKCPVLVVRGDIGDGGNFAEQEAACAIVNV